MHNPTLLGFSLLILSCASPTLGTSSETSSGVLGATSAPSSPSLSFNPPLKPFNPVEAAPVSSAAVLEATEIPTTSGLSSQIVRTSSAEFRSSSPALATSDTAPTTSSPDQIKKAHPTPVPSSRPSIHDALRVDALNFGLLSHSEDGPLSTQLNVQAGQPPEGTALPQIAMHSKVSPSTHRKLAQKFKPSSVSLTSSSTPSSVAPKSGSPSDSMTSSDSARYQTNRLQASGTSALSVPHFSPTRLVVNPTSDVLDDPNPDVRSQTASDASELARRRSILAAFLILGTLGALGGGILCFKCGVLPCCHGKDRHRRSRNSMERVTEEGLRKPARVASIEKSIIPGAPPPLQTADLPSLSRDSHTPSCSTCPDSLNGVRSGISGGISDWRVYATNEEGQFEDVTHILSSDAFSVRSAEDSRPASAGSWSQRNSTESRGSGKESEAQSSIHSRTDSRVSESGASMTAESYKSCESRYSTPSFERHSREAPRSSRSSSSSLFRSPSPPASVSVLLRTPEQADYAALVDAALPLARVVDATVAVPAQSPAVVESETEDMELDSQWDVAQAYGAPLPKESQDAAPGRKILGVTVAEQSVGAVELGGRTCLLMRG